MVTAPAATVRWGYFWAADLIDVRLDTRRTRVTARVVSADAGRIGRAGLVLAVPHGRGAWRWRLGAVTVAGDRLAADLNTEV